jgi:hypothetical protein
VRVAANYNQWHLVLRNSQHVISLIVALTRYFLPLLVTFTLVLKSTSTDVRSN